MTENPQLRGDYIPHEVAVFESLTKKQRKEYTQYERTQTPSSFLRPGEWMTKFVTLDEAPVVPVVSNNIDLFSINPGDNSLTNATLRNQRKPNRVTNRNVSKVVSRVKSKLYDVSSSSSSESSSSSSESSSDERRKHRKHKKHSRKEEKVRKPEKVSFKSKKSSRSSKKSLSSSSDEEEQQRSVKIRAKRSLNFGDAVPPPPAFAAKHSHDAPKEGKLIIKGPSVLEVSDILASTNFDN